MWEWLKSFGVGDREATKESYELSDEDFDAVGTVVETLSFIGTTTASGRIRFRGSSWSALCPDGEIPAGQLARIVYRDNIAWVVEPYYGNCLPGEKDLF
jgi:membrane protein implicated in regulation of membrane protease activity